MKLDQTPVLITGGGRGLGRSLVDHFLAAGSEVAVFEYDPKLADELRSTYGERIRVWCCDVSDPDAVDHTCAKAFGPDFIPHVLVNNAGIIHNEPLVNLTRKEKRLHSRASWQRVIATDLDSVFYVTSNVVDALLQKRQPGVVISISSICSAGNPGQSAYSAAKAGVNALTATWSKEWGAFGLRFAAIAPGFLDTSSTREAMGEKKLADVTARIPLRALGQPESVWHAVRYIIENDYVTGTVLEVDGGLVL